MGRLANRPEPRVTYICKHCKVQVISKTNKAAIYMAEHKPGCPRRKVQ